MPNLFRDAQPEEIIDKAVAVIAILVDMAQLFFMPLKIILYKPLYHVCIPWSLRTPSTYLNSPFALQGRFHALWDLFELFC